VIKVYTGKPRAGKSYGANDAVLEELEHGTRGIVTNLALRQDVMNEYFQRKGRQFADVFARVRIISKEETSEFWRFHTNFTVLPNWWQRKIDTAQVGAQGERRRVVWSRRDRDAVKEDDGTEAVEVLSEILGPDDGLLIIIDEAHVPFDSRSWAKSGASLTFMNSQHAKLHYDIIFVTQFLKLIELRIRGFAESFHVFKNFMGLVVYNFLRMPRKIRELVYSVEPGSPGATVDREHWHTLDYERAQCYDTMAGVGVMGGRVHDTRVFRGFSVPWWSVVVVIVLIGVAMWYAPAAAGKVLTRTRTEEHLKERPAVPQPEPVNLAVVPGVPGASSRLLETAARVTMLGYVFANGNAIVSLSDGRRLRRGDLRSLDEDKAVDLQGVVYWKHVPRLNQEEPEARQSGVSSPVPAVPLPGRLSVAR